MFLDLSSRVTVSIGDNNRYSLKFLFEYYISFVVGGYTGNDVWSNEIISPIEFNVCRNYVFWRRRPIVCALLTEINYFTPLMEQHPPTSICNNRSVHSSSFPSVRINCSDGWGSQEENFRVIFYYIIFPFFSMQFARQQRVRQDQSGRAIPEASGIAASGFKEK